MRRFIGIVFLVVLIALTGCSVSETSNATGNHILITKDNSGILKGAPRKFYYDSTGQVFWRDAHIKQTGVIGKGGYYSTKTDGWYEIKVDGCYLFYNSEEKQCYWADSEGNIVDIDLSWKNGISDNVILTKGGKYIYNRQEDGVE